MIPRIINRLTPAQKDRVLQAHGEGKSNREIADEMGIDGRQVVGTIRHKGNFKRNRSRTLALPTVTSEVQASSDTVLAPEMATPAIPEPAPQDVSPTQSSTPTQDQIQPPTKEHYPMSGEFSWQTSPPQTPGSPGIGYTGQAVRIEVERVYPPDGFLGSHGTLTRDEMGKIYGSGTYTLTRYEPGKQTMVAANVVISPNFGEPRAPQRHQQEERPFSRFRQSQSQNEGASFRPGFGQNQNQNSQESPSSTIKNLVDASEKILDMSSKRNPQPAQQDSSLAEIAKELVKTAQAGTGQDFFRQWTIEQEKNRERERREEAERRDREKKEDIDHRDRERREEEARWQRTVDLDRIRTESRERELSELHKREMERVRAENEARHKFYEEERKTLMSLEDKKREALAEQHKAEMRLLDKKLEESQENMANFQDQIREEHEKDRKHDQEILKLERDRLIIQAQHENEKLSMLKKEMESRVSDQSLTGLIKELVMKADNRLGQHIETEQMKLIASEAEKRGIKIEDVVAGAAGNIQPGTAVPAGNQVQGASAPGNGHKNGNGNGHAKEEPMSIIDRVVKTPAFEEICEEWSVHVEGEADPTTFANAILTNMSTEDPERRDLKIGATMFQTIIAPRKWSRLFDAIKGSLKPEIRKIFETPYAEQFYEGFRSILSIAVNSHYSGLMTSREDAVKEKLETTEPRVTVGDVK